MKNFSYLLLGIFFLTACSKDDDTILPAAEIPIDEKLVESAEFSTLRVTFEYNSRKQVANINFGDFQYYAIKYDENLVEKITVVSGEIQKDFEFTHNAQGKISSLKVNGVATPIIYNEATNNYNDAIYLNDEGDVKMAYDDMGTVTNFIYDNTKNGGYRNSQDINVYLLLCGMTSQFPLIISNHPLKLMSTDQGNISIENQYDSQDFASSVQGIRAGHVEFQGVIHYKQL